MKKGNRDSEYQSPQIKVVELVELNVLTGSDSALMKMGKWDVTQDAPNFD